MNSTTIDHDCYLEDDIVLSSNVILGGNIHIMKNANLGMKTIVHQNQVIGSLDSRVVAIVQLMIFTG